MNYAIVIAVISAITLFFKDRSKQKKLNIAKGNKESDDRLIKNNNDLKKKYEEVKIDSNVDLNDKLSKGDF